MLYGADQAYKLGLPKDALKMSAGFGGGMGIEKVCGVLAAGVMVLGTLTVQDRAHESEKIKELTREFLQAYCRDMGGMDCGYLKENYRIKEEGCFRVILKGAEILDGMVAREVPGRTG